MVINFWTSWCGPCRVEAPHLVKLYEKYKNQIEIFAINLTASDSVEGAKAFAEGFGFTFPVLLDQKADVAKKYQINPIPTTFFVNGEGIIVDKIIGIKYGTSTILPWGISIKNPDYKYHPVNVYLLFVTVPMLIWLWKSSSSSLGSGKMMLNVLTYYGMGLMSVSFFKQKTSLLMGLSGEQLLYLLLMFLGFLLSIFLNRQIQQEITSVAERIGKQNDATGISPFDSGNAAIDPIGSEDSREEKRPTFSD